MQISALAGLFPRTQFYYSLGIKATHLRAIVHRTSLANCEQEASSCLFTPRTVLNERDNSAEVVALVQPRCSRLAAILPDARDLHVINTWLSKMDSLCLEAVSFDASELVTRYLYKHPFKLLLNIRMWMLINSLMYPRRGVFLSHLRNFDTAAKIAI